MPRGSLEEERWHATQAGYIPVTNEGLWGRAVICITHRPGRLVQVLWGAPNGLVTEIA